MNQKEWVKTQAQIDKETNEAIDKAKKEAEAAEEEARSGASGTRK
jgi:hypothetical protein